jgi:hypothetical protein
MYGRGVTKRTAVLAFAVALLGGCAQDAICRSDEYPVQQVGGTGRQCVPQKQEPPAGWARYPAGQEPRHVDDKWDVFWRTHAPGRDGTVVEIG